MKRVAVPVCFILIAIGQGRTFGSDGARISTSELEAGTIQEVLKVDKNKVFDTYPVNLCWSTDGATLYIRAATRPEKSMLGREVVNNDTVDYRDFSLRVDGSDFQLLAELPEESLQYWTFKSSESSPDGEHSVRIERKFEDRGQGRSRRRTRVHFVYLGKEVIGRTEDYYIERGDTYSWAPTHINGIAFVDDDFDLYMMEPDGTNKKLLKKGTLFLPAWSPDGTKIAAIQNHDRANWSVIVASLSGSAKL